ncbi:MAG TPA: hypothetical protein PKB02_04100 [Anaerohalosphaeraceae bacterium]|nr:hypothetical protein [Anaerohalosphaeraceae bacterium]
MLKGLKGFIILLGGLVALGPFAPAENSFEPYFILTGTETKITEPNFCMITNQQDWISLWGQHKGMLSREKAEDTKDRQLKQKDLEAMYLLYSQTDVPRINFDKCVVVAIFTGPIKKPSCLKLVKIIETDNQVELYYICEEDSTQKKDVSAYGFYVLPKTDKDIILFENKDSRESPFLKKAILTAPVNSVSANLPINEKEWALREMLIREEMESWISIAPDKVIFIQFEANQDPPDEFIKRLSGSGITIKKCSRSNGNPISGVRDNFTGANGIIIFAHITKRINENKVEVEYGYYMGGLAARRNKQGMEYKNGKWQLDPTVPREGEIS